MRILIALLIGIVTLLVADVVATTLVLGWAGPDRPDMAFPAWIAGGVIGLLCGLAAVVLYLRRSRAD